MKTTADFLDALRVKLDLPSDNALGKHLGIHRQHISHYRNLRGTFDDETSIRIAEILEVKPAFVMACMHYQRAKSPKVRDAWQYLGGLAAALALVAFLPFIHLPETGLIPASGAFDNNGYYTSQNIHYTNLGLLLLFLIIIALLAFSKGKRDDSKRH